VVKSVINLATLSGLFIYMLDFRTVSEESKFHLLATHLSANPNR